ncbi:MAG: ABC transporter ATP-binding protein [Christensenellaceae bacterium]|jgi:NitT/TauT family transport system ATP-binding protein|nr:ABC transporter ATP-binding protein [Christensenellaceae bacterium]
MIKFDNVSFFFDNNEILSKLSCQFDDNKIHCVLGPSGCGKTTILNLIAGLLKTKSGSITGIDKRISYVFQDERLIYEKTARGNLDFVLAGVYSDRNKRRVLMNTFLELVGLDSAKNLYPREMSGGMKQRLVIARAFVYPSDILLLDEPFKALDVNLRCELIKLFLKLWTNDKRTTIFVTHDITEAMAVADNIYVFGNKPLSTLKQTTIEAPRNKMIDAHTIYDNADKMLKLLDS